MPLTNTARKRIMKDITELKKHPLHSCGIYVNHLDDDITQATALLIGPDKTPYEHGFYFFEIKFPDNYPFDPPKVKFITSDPMAKTRFHPNLYVDGKVCLSILNTWSGPSWTSVQTFSSVLLSIKSLLDEKPLENEPGFENTSQINNDNFNGCIQYKNFDVAILYQLKRLHSNCQCYQPVMEDYFLKNFSQIRELCEKVKVDSDGKEFNSPTYNMKIKTDYSKILIKLDEQYNILLKKHQAQTELQSAQLQPEAQPAQAQPAQPEPEVQQQPEPQQVQPPQPLESSAKVDSPVSAGKEDVKKKKITIFKKK